MLLAPGIHHHEHMAHLGPIWEQCVLGKGQIPCGLVVGVDLWKGDSLILPATPSSHSVALQSEAKWTAQIAELEKERGGLVEAMACREEELSALRQQLEYTQIKLSSAQASNGHPLGLTKSNFIVMGLGSVCVEAEGL